MLGKRTAADHAAPVVRARDKTRWQRLYLLARRHPTGSASVVVIALLLVMSLFAPMIATDSPYAIDTPNRLSAPSPEAFSGPITWAATYLAGPSTGVASLC